MKKRLISLLLVLVLMLSMIPAVRAASQDGNKEYVFKDSRGNEVIVPENAFATRVVSFEPGSPWTMLTEHKA